LDLAANKKMAWPRIARIARKKKTDSTETARNDPDAKTAKKNACLAVPLAA
jgi:hypothetical protein